MKRAVTAALCVALFALACLTGPKASAQSIGSSPGTLPNLVTPELFRGFEPIPPDEFGLSPRGEFLVFQDGNSLQVVRTESDRVVFDERVTGPASLSLDVGFDPGDNVLFLLQTNSSGDFRFRAIDLFTGLSLFDRHFQDRPEIRTDLHGTVNVIITRTSLRAMITVFNAFGRITLRRSYPALADVALNLARPSVAILSSTSSGQTRIEVYNAVGGQPTLRATATGTFEAGFQPFGGAFVVAQSTSTNTFRVKMVQSLSGRILVSRTFTGTPRVGFTPDGSLLGVESFGSLSTQLLLFSTRTGQQLFTQRSR